MFWSEWGGGAKWVVFLSEWGGGAKWVVFLWGCGAGASTVDTTISAWNIIKLCTMSEALVTQATKEKVVYTQYCIQPNFMKKHAGEI